MDWYIFCCYFIIFSIGFAVGTFITILLDNTIFIPTAGVSLVLLGISGFIYIMELDKAPGMKYLEGFMKARKEFWKDEEDFQKKHNADGETIWPPKV